MKKARPIFWFLLVCLLVLTVYHGAVDEKAPEGIDFGSAVPMEGQWKQEEGALYFTGEIPASGEPQVLLLRTHWRDYAIEAGGQPIYSASDECMGAFHLFAVPEGTSLTICFLGTDESNAESVQQAGMYLGSKSGVYAGLVRQNLYALAFGILSLLLGTLCIYIGFYLRQVRFGEFFDSMLSLGLYVLCAGVWVVTDSKLLLLATSRTGIVELVSFLSFYLMPLPLLEFTKKTVPERAKKLGMLQKHFVGTLVLFMGCYLFHVLNTTLLIVTEHLLMAVTIGIMLYFGIGELRRHENRVLKRVIFGYVAFSVSSMAAIAFFYVGNSGAYSRLYVLGIVAFVFCLTDAAANRIYERVQENTKLAMYAKLAYLDQMTGLGNRTAFIEANRALEGRGGMLAYIMVDVNHLKKVNDSLGHQAGDRLITQVGQSMGRAVEADGKCCRIGGDEFAVILQNLKESQVRACVERIQVELQKADQAENFPVSAAIGWAWAEHPEDSEQLFRQADDNMYREKKRMKAQRKE